ncbi:MAG: PQQ-binding-like beta-propeller repeat protein, partial [Chloroflexota bacterium]
MNTRTLVTIVLALVLICIVMAVSGLMAWGGWVNPNAFSVAPVWQQAYADAQSMKIIDLTGDGQAELFIQGPRNASIYSASGEQLSSFDFPNLLATTLGDVTGDGVEDVVSFYSDWTNGSLQVFSQGAQAAAYPVSNISEARRAAVMRFPEGPQIVVGDANGLLVGLGVDGGERWRLNVGGHDEIRGLDDTRVSGQAWLAAANHDGTVMLLDAQGAALWQYTLAGGLRRLRAYDLNGDGTSELALGGELGTLALLDAAGGSELWSRPLGQAVSEIREAEADGDPASRELIVGGKDGGVWAYTLTGEKLWSRSMTDKVTEISSVDLDGDGAAEIIIGDETGEVKLFTGSGEGFTLLSVSGLVNRIDG